MNKKLQRMVFEIERAITNNEVENFAKMILERLDEHNAEKKAIEVQIETKDKEIRRLKKYMEENDPLSMYKLWLNETIKEVIVKPLVKDLIDKKMVKTEDE